MVNLLVKLHTMLCYLFFPKLELLLIHPVHSLALYLRDPFFPGRGGGQYFRGESFVTGLGVSQENTLDNQEF